MLLNCVLPKHGEIYTLNMKLVHAENQLFVVCSEVQSMVVLAAAIFICPKKWTKMWSVGGADKINVHFRTSLPFTKFRLLRSSKVIFTSCMIEASG